MRDWCNAVNCRTLQRETIVNPWYVYIVRCADATYYCGVAKDVQKRLQEHNASDKLGARYTKARRPVALVYSEPVPSRSAAVKREGQIKRLTRKQKEQLIAASFKTPKGLGVLPAGKQC